MKILDLFNFGKLKSKAEEILDSIDAPKYTQEQRIAHLDTIREHGQFRIVQTEDLYSFQLLTFDGDDWINSSCQPYKTIDGVIEFLIYYINSDKQKEELDKKEWKPI